MLPYATVCKMIAASGLILLVSSPCLADASVRDMEARTRAPSARYVVVAQTQDACAAIDDAVVAQALEGPVTRDTNPQSALPGMCAWRSNGVPGDGLTVQVDDGGQEKYDFDHSNLPVHDLQGVGDEAFAFVSPAGFVQLGMMKGGTYVTIVLGLQNGRDRLKRAVDLASTIAARL